MIFTYTQVRPFSKSYLRVRYLLRIQQYPVNKTYNNTIFELILARIAQLVVYWLGNGHVPGSNPGKGQK